MVMDSTAANRSALAMIREKFLHMVLLGCQAHALSLFVKDLANKKKTKWASGVLETALMLVNGINDNERIKAAIQEQQQEIYKKVRPAGLLCW